MPRMILRSLILFTIFLASCSSPDKGAKNGKGTSEKTGPDPSFASLSEVQDSLRAGVQTKNIDPSKDTVLRFKKGSMIYLPARSLRFPDGSVPEGEVELRVKECYSLACRVGDDLTTRSDDRLLETGGMLKIEAEKDGKTLEMADDEKYRVYFPNKAGKKKEGMKMFTGERAQDGDMNWNEGSIGKSRLIEIDVVEGDTVKIDTMVYDVQSLSEEDRKRFEKKFAGKLEDVDKDAMNGYIMGASQLGWINCDRFRDLRDDQKTNYVVRIDSSMDHKVVMSFKGIESMMNAKLKGDKAVFSSVPKGREVKIIGIRYEKDGPALTTQSTTIGDQEVRLDGFEKMTLEGVKKELNSISS